MHLHPNDAREIFQAAEHELTSSPVGTQAAPGAPQQALSPELKKFLAGALSDFLTAFLKRLAGGIPGLGAPGTQQATK